MKEATKTKGAWVIRVRRTDAGRGADFGHDKCSLSSSEDLPHCNEQKKTTDEKEEFDTDFYTYYLRRLENRPDQQSALYSCRDMALRLFDTGPLTWSITSGAALLCALHECKLKPGTDIMPVFNEIEQAMFSELQGVRLDLESDIHSAVRNTGCCERTDRRNRSYRKER